MFYYILKHCCYKNIRMKANRKFLKVSRNNCHSFIKNQNHGSPRFVAISKNQQPIMQKKKKVEVL